MYNYERWIVKASIGMAILAAVFFVVATSILTWMVVARWFGLHSSWELELSIELMISAIFLASPYTLMTGGHVKMDLLGSMLGAKPRATLSIITEIIGFLICLFLGVKGLELTYDAFVSNERGMGLWQPLLWPRYATVPIGMFMTCLQYIVLIRSDRKKMIATSNEKGEELE